MEEASIFGQAEALAPGKTSPVAQERFDKRGE
jgi:hypothetical protein